MSERGYCTSCGARLEPGNAFCTSCGAPAEAGTRATDRSATGAAPSVVAFLSGWGTTFRTLTQRIRAFFKLSGVAWGSAAVGLLMVLLVALFPLVSPAVGLAYPMVLRVPLLLFAAGALGWLIDEGGREGRRRRGFGWLALIALAVYLFAAAYRLLLGVFGFVEGSAPVWLLVLVAGCGLACAAFGVRNRGGGDATPERPSLFGGGWRHALAGVARWVKALPRGVAAAVVVGALGTLSLFSPYVFVLGAVSVVVGVVALIVRAARRRPLKGAGTVALAALALTLAFGAVSDALYRTGTGLEVSVISGTEDSRADAPSVGGADRLASDAGGLAFSWSDPYTYPIDPTWPPVPRYEVLRQDFYSEPGPPTSRAYPHEGAVVSVAVEDTRLEALKLVVNNVALNSGDFDLVSVTLSDADKLSADGTPRAGEVPLVGMAMIALSTEGEEASLTYDARGEPITVPEDHYQLRLWQDDEGGAQP